MVELRFTNQDATPKVAIIKTRKGDVPAIMAEAAIAEALSTGDAS